MLAGGTGGWSINHLFLYGTTGKGKPAFTGEDGMNWMFSVSGNLGAVDPQV
jgi:hypothetical protein